MSFTIYRIDIVEVEGNHFSLGRDESWTVREDRTFDNEQDAKNYILDRSKIFTDCVLLVQPLIARGASNEEKQKFYNGFCFDDDTYIKYRRFFIGKPPIEDIKAALKNDGVKIRRQ